MSQLDTHLLSDASSNTHRSDAPWLRDADAASAAVPSLVQVLRQLCGLASTGLSNKHNDLNGRLCFQGLGQG
jgi:hypothetical protein